MLLSILPFKIRNTEEYGNNSSGKKLEVIGIKTEADNKLHYYIVNNSAECNFKILPKITSPIITAARPITIAPLPILTSAKP